MFENFKNYFEQLILKIYFFIKGCGAGSALVFAKIKINIRDLMLIIDVDDKYVLKSLILQVKEGVVEVFSSNEKVSFNNTKFLNQSGFKNSNIKIHSPEEIPNFLKGDKFNLIVWGGLNNHKNPMTALTAINQMMGSGGLLYVVCFDFDSYSLSCDYIKRILSKVYFKIFNSDEIKHIVASAGLNLIGDTKIGCYRIFKLNKGGY